MPPNAAGQKLTFRVPPGTLNLTEQPGSTLRRWNGQSVTDGMAVAEALVALAVRLKTGAGMPSRPASRYVGLASTATVTVSWAGSA